MKAACHFECRHATGSFSSSLQVRETFKDSVSDTKSSQIIWQLIKHSVTATWLALVNGYMESLWSMVAKCLTHTHVLFASGFMSSFKFHQEKVGAFSSWPGF